MSMRERHQILELWKRMLEMEEPGVLATVVRTEGSSYRVPGARLLIARNGARAGSVSGGCLEDDILKKAWWLSESGPVIRRYDTTPEGEIAASGYGLGCNGVVHVLLERVTAERPSVLPLLRDAKELRRPVTVAHVLSPANRVGERAVSPDNNSSHSDGDIFLERIVPSIHLLIFGAGQDAVPMSELAVFLGWQVSVFDGRAHYARAEKFPGGVRVSVRPPGEPPPPPIDCWTAAVLMTHSYSQDLDALRGLRGAPLRYLGLLGPRKRSEQLLAELNGDKPANWEQLCAPMGLDLGADGPEQVAIAVLAEIQAVMNGRSAGFLRDRARPIHTPAGAAESEAWIRSIVCA